jgi:hypothetical protein
MKENVVLKIHKKSMSYYSCDHVRGCVVTVQPTASMFSKLSTNDGIL